MAWSVELILSVTFVFIAVFQYLMLSLVQGLGY